MKKSHMWLMILCCLIPVLGLVAVYFFKVPVSNVLLYGLILFCPLSHLFMMQFMGHDHSLTEQHSAHQHYTSSVITAPNQENKP